MRNLIALQKGMVVVPAPAPAAPANRQLAASLQAELMNLGWMLDGPAFEAACRAPAAWLTSFHADAVSCLRQSLGADRPYAAMYRNFPAQVMAMSELELFVNAVYHYQSNGTWEPPAALKARGVRFENTSFKLLRLAAEEQFKQIFADLVAVNTSLTEDDRKAVAWFVDTYGAALPMPASVPFKETLCILAAKDLDVPVKTPTDVLRIAAYLSGGDPSLPPLPPPVKPPAVAAAAASPYPTWFFQRWMAGIATDHAEAVYKTRRAARDKFKFKKFPRRQRRHLLALLETTGADVTDMQRHLGRWLRLGEVLHVGEFAARFPRSAESFRRLRNQHDAKTKVRTFPARVDLAFRDDWRKGVDVLATRPGEFARRLDWMLRNFDRGYVLETFARVAADVSSKVLFELYDHFGARVRPGAPRAVMLKGRGSKMKSLPPLPPLDRDLVQQVGNVILRTLRSRVAALPPMGKVFIDERLKQVPVPFAMRSVNTSVRTYVRGTRLPFRPDARVVRAFLHWQDDKGEYDLDLSAGLYTENFAQVSHVSFTNLKDDTLHCCHSGDVRHRRGPCAEYVDLSINQCLAHGVRYAVIQVFNYNGLPMHQVKHCVFGLMEREHAQANKLFVPKTVSDCMPLANEGTCVVACVVDLKDRNYVWADVESERSLPTLENTASRTGEVIRALVQNTKMSVFDLLTLHARERGTIVADPAGADAVMRWDDFVRDYAKVAGYMTV